MLEMNKYRTEKKRTPRLKSLQKISGSDKKYFRRVVYAKLNCVTVENPKTIKINFIPCGSYHKYCGSK